jgi:hypothetical protein
MVSPRSSASGLARQHHLFGDRGQVDRVAPVQAPLAAGQREQGLDQPFLLLAGGQPPPADVLQRGDRRPRFGHRHFYQRALPGQRGA